MACSSPDPGEDGFATSAAMVASMTLAMVASALTAAGVAELERARAEHHKLEAEFALADAQRLADLVILQHGVRGRLSWSIEGPRGPVRILAEPEYDKASFQAAGRDDDDDNEKALARFGVSDPGALGRKLAAGDLATGDEAWLEGLDRARLWRRCAASMISRFGGSRKLVLTQAGAPDQAGFSWRPGEVWRVRASLADGWVDDRVVRFTGDQLQPAAAIERRLSRTGQGNGTCDELIAPVQ